MRLKDQLTVIYYTSNREDESFEKKIREKLFKSIGDLPLISVSQKPIDFGGNICVGNVGVSNQNALRQFETGAMHAKTPFVVAAEADTLYPKGYFKYIPRDINQACVYNNIWALYKNSKGGFVKMGYSACAQVWGREILIRHVEKRLKGKGQWRKTPESGQEVPIMFRRPSFVLFKGKDPVVSLKTDKGMYRATEEISTQTPKNPLKLPFWGTAEKLRKEYFS